MDEELSKIAMAHQRLDVYHIGRSSLILHFGLTAGTKDIDVVEMRDSKPEMTVHERLALGTPSQAITTVARRVDASLVVMSSLGRTGLPGFVIGNTAERLLRLCDRSILTAKPHSSVSPV